MSVDIQQEAECASEPLRNREKPFPLTEVETRFPECAAVCSLVSIMICALRDPDLKLRAVLSDILSVHSMSETINFINLGHWDVSK